MTHLRPPTTTAEPRRQDPAVILSGTVLVWRNGAGHLVRGTVETARHRLGGYQVVVRDAYQIRHRLDLTPDDLRAAMEDQERARRLIDDPTPADPLAARVVAERIVRGGRPGIPDDAALRLLATAYLDSADGMGLARPRLREVGSQPTGEVA